MDTGLGKLISRHGRSKSSLFLTGLFVAIFTGVGIFVMLLPMLTANSNSHMAIGASVLYGIGICLAAVGLLPMGVVLYLHKKKPIVCLHEEGLLIEARDNPVICRFEQMADFYQFTYGGFAFRKEPNTPWVFVRTSTAQYRQLHDQVLERQVEKRGQLLLSQLSQGNAVTFRFFSMLDGFKKSLVATSNLAYETNDIVLTHTSLTIAGKTYLLEDIASLKSNAWSEILKIQDKKGAVLFSTHISSVLSADLLFSLIVALEEPVKANMASATYA